MMKRLALLVLTQPVLLAGCTHRFETDGSSDAKLIAAWLNGGSDSQYVASNAMFSYSGDLVTPLSHRSFATSSPDHNPNCARDTVRTNGIAVEATWRCKGAGEGYSSKVYFYLRNGKIVNAQDNVSMM